MKATMLDTGAGSAWSPAVIESFRRVMGSHLTRS
jgi:hypothetical protein